MKMFKRYSLLTTLFAVGLALAISGTALAAESTAVLDHQGTLYTLLSGRRGDLFAGVTGPAANAPVLALEIREPGEAPGDTETRRMLVADTGDAAREESASLVMEEASGSVFVVWSRIPVEGPVELRVSGLVETRWSDPVSLEAAGDLTVAPQLLVTRDRMSKPDPDTGVPRSTARTVLHLLWAENTAEGERVLYSPLVLEDGAYVGEAPRMVLNDFDPTTTTVPGHKDATSDSAPTLAAGIDNQSVIAGFVNTATGRQLSIELRMLPFALGTLSRDVREFILEEGVGIVGPGSVESLAGGVGGMIIETGREFHPGVRFYFASVAQEAVLEEALASDGPGVGLQSLAGGVGGMIIEVGSRFFGTDGLDRNFVTSRLSLVEITSAVELDPETLVNHLLRVYVVSDREAPDVGSDAALLVSGDGEEGLVAWPEGAELRYRETNGAVWSDVRAVSLGEDLDLEQARQLLQQRLQRR
jgi:hypothetical protein